MFNFNTEEKEVMDKFFEIIAKHSETNDVSLLVGNKGYIKLGGPYKWIITPKSDEKPGTYHKIGNDNDEPDPFDDGLYKNKEK